ncbi:hypothetical protein V8C43DRAFT_121814 [Trichoderma afarasin]
MICANISRTTAGALGYLPDQTWIGQSARCRTGTPSPSPACHGCLCLSLEPVATSATKDKRRPHNSTGRPVPSSKMTFVRRKRRWYATASRCFSTLGSYPYRTTTERIGGLETLMKGSCGNMRCGWPVRKCWKLSVGSSEPMYSWIGLISLHCFHKPGHHNFGLNVDTLPAANQLPYYQPHQTAVRLVLTPSSLERGVGGP